ncbi:MAG TPA: hypothetical protein VFJ95_10285, partial [Gammaproteobacteria bacterium]|nr:hypothetical protein [Gammaproteobacteria bacterium]
LVTLQVLGRDCLRLAAFNVWNHIDPTSLCAPKDWAIMEYACTDNKGSSASLSSAQPRKPARRVDIAYPGMHPRLSIQRLR